MLHMLASEAHAVNTSIRPAVKSCVQLIVQPRGPAFNPVVQAGLLWTHVHTTSRTTQKTLAHGGVRRELWVR